MIKVLVTGANGQLGQCIRDAGSAFQKVDFQFVSREDLDIEDHTSIQDFFRRNAFDYCINTAAYTNVEKAESESDRAFSINADAVKNLVKVCNEYQTTLIHISTDYVFDGCSNRPYLETDETNPLNVYGASKLRGEQHIEEICKKYFIVRTSWLYSQYGHNFLNTILKYVKENKDLSITTEQLGTPTNANDLAQTVLKIACSSSTDYGIYHFSNNGEATWYDFAFQILNESQVNNNLKLTKSNAYPTVAARPKYSVLDKFKIVSAFNIELIDWVDSLKKVIRDIHFN